MNVARALEGVGIALDSIRSNKVRAGLTILGVAIGVMVVIAMASAITGVNRSITAMLESAGPKTFFVQRFFQGGLNISDGSDELSPWRKNPWITVEDAELVHQLPLVQDVSVSEGTEGPVSYEDISLKGVLIAGFGPSWVLVTGGEIVSGRTFTSAEYAAGAHVAVVNDKLAESLFPRGVDPVGKRIRVFGQPFTIVGVHVEAASLFGGGDQVRMAMPHTTFVKVADYRKGWMDFSVLPVASATSLEAQEEVISALRAKRGLKPMQENNFAVLSQDKILDSFNNITAGFFAVMVALSGVGLMVGGVGVVAIMMISVTERTREIGVRKALGATKREIMFQFLVEAATLTVVGGTIGLALGALIAVAIRSNTTIPASVPLWSVVVSLAASVVTGVLFGLYPAFRAARLDPVEALRFE
ncbi:MAG: MacB-like periplasmic core domain protein [Gemmatimonadetes bacterium]|jgi:putative ABC transport system permease protein|nr:MacB-like periplasmic core domain protein [Gemmatimonadota bacterium]